MGASACMGIFAPFFLSLSWAPTQHPWALRCGRTLALPRRAACLQTSGG